MTNSREDEAKIELIAQVIYDRQFGNEAGSWRALCTGATAGGYDSFSWRKRNDIMSTARLVYNTAHGRNVP